MKKPLASILIIVALVSSLILFIPQIPNANAAVVIEHTCQSSASAGSSTSCNLPIFANGDIIIIVVLAFENSNSACPPGFTSTYPKDSQGNTLTLINDSGCLSGAFHAGIEIWSYYTTASSTSTDTLSVSFVGVPSSYQIAGYDVNGGSTANIESAVFTSLTAAAGTNYGTSSLSYASNSVLIANLAGPILAFTYTDYNVPAGFTILGAFNGADCTATASSYDTTASSGSTTFSSSITNAGGCPASGPFMIQGIVVGPGLTVTLPIDCSTNHGTNAGFTLSGGSPSPSSITCSPGGTTTNVSLAPSTQLTITVPSDNATTRYRSVNGTTSVKTSCASGTCSTFNVLFYYELHNTYQCTPSSPVKWDGIYACTAKGTLAGSSGTTISTVNTASGGGAVSASGWSDYGIDPNLPATLNAYWDHSSTNAFTPTSGGNTFNTNYAVNQTVTITVAESPNNIINGLVVNGNFYSATTTFSFQIASSQNITASKTGLGPGAKLYGFSSWSDSGARSHLITVPSTPTTYTASFVTPPPSIPTCGGPTPFIQLQTGCWLPAVVNFYSIPLGLPMVLGILLGDIDMAIFIKTRNAIIAAVVFTIGVSVLGAALPGIFSEIAYGTLSLAVAGVIYKLYTLRS